MQAKRGTVHEYNLESALVAVLSVPVLLMADRMSLRLHASECDRQRDSVLSVKKIFLCLSVSTATRKKAFCYICYVPYRERQKNGMPQCLSLPACLLCTVPCCPF